MAANVSGTVLSSLFYDQTSCPGDQEGYLLGKIVSHVQDKISDSQISSCKVETVLYIYSYLPWPSEDKFYSTAGRVNPTKAITLLKGKHQDLIGWYKFRRNSTLRPSLKESNLHHSLLESLPVDQHNNFLFFLCSASLSYNKATHTFDHVLLRHHNGKFQKVTMSVINLGDTTHTEYKSRGNLTINPTGASLQTVIDQFQSDFMSDSGGMLEINKVRGLSTTLHSKLQGLCHQVEKSEVQLAALEEEVKLMSYRLLEQEEKRKEEKKAEEKALSPPPQLVTPPLTSTVSPTSDSRKHGGGRSDHRLRVGVSESGRRPRQISIEDDEIDREETVRRSPEPSLIDFEIKEIGVKTDILKPESNSMEVDKTEPNPQSERTSHKVKLESVVESSQQDVKQSRTRDKVVKKSDVDTGNSKSADAFSFVSNILEKEKENLTEKPSNSTAPASHEVEKPTAKREPNINSAASSRRPQSRAETQAMQARKNQTGDTAGKSMRFNSPSARTRQPGPSQAVASTSEVKGERSRPQRMRSRPGPAVRSRSRESPPANQKLGISSASRTKSASPSHCRTPIRKTPCENGTEAAGMIDDATLSSSPVF